MKGPKPVRILVVEDNEANRNLLLETLDLFGYAADVAPDGHQALEKIAAQRYDLIFMDYRMPRLDGLETSRRIRSMERDTDQPPARIVALTANAMVGDRERCLAAGMDEYMAKPIDLMALKALVERLLAEDSSAGI